MHVFLDESGGLSFDFTKGGTTRVFVICLLILRTPKDYRLLTKAVERTIRNKLHKGRPPRRPMDELKGSKTDLSVKAYFYRQAKKVSFEIYTLILNKPRVYNDLRRQPERLYNFIGRMLLEKCPFTEVKDRIILTLDRRKSIAEIQRFNQYLLAQLRGSLPLKVPFEIFHEHSWKNKGLQATDLFCWGIFRKYERGDTSWYQIFRERIKFESVYLP